MDRPSKPSPIPFSILADLVEEGVGRKKCYTERRLAPGEARTKIAFLSFSSGTTGRPKVGAGISQTRVLLDNDSDEIGCRYTTLRSHCEYHPNVIFP